MYIIILPTSLIYYNELQKPVQCLSIIKDTYFLNRHFYNSHLAYSYKNIDNYIINEIFDKILNLRLNKMDFNLLEFRNFNGKRFPRYHPLAHYHLNFVDFSNINTDILVNMQFSTQNFNNCYCLSNKNLFGMGKSQYISNNFYFYEKKSLINKIIDIKTFNYLNKYNDDIIDHINNVKNFYKL